MPSKLPKLNKNLVLRMHYQFLRRLWKNHEKNILVKDDSLSISTFTDVIRIWNCSLNNEVWYEGITKVFKLLCELQVTSVMCQKWWFCQSLSFVREKFVTFQLDTMILSWRASFSSFSRFSSDKARLFNLQTSRRSGSWKAALKRGKCILQSKRSYSIDI